MTSSESSIPAQTISILDCAQYLQKSFLLNLNTSVTLQQVNSLSSIDNVVLRPNVPAVQRLDKWLPALSIRSSLPPELLQQQKQLASKAYTSSTKLTYGSGLVKFHEYCDTIGLPEVNRAPVNTTIIAGFITYLSGFYSKTSIINFVSVVKA